MAADGKGFDHWGEDARHPVSDWKYEVKCDDTRIGYWEWLAKKLEQDEDDGL